MIFSPGAGKPTEGLQAEECPFRSVFLQWESEAQNTYTFMLLKLFANAAATIVPFLSQRGVESGMGRGMGRTVGKRLGIGLTLWCVRDVLLEMTLTQQRPGNLVSVCAEAETHLELT